MVFNISLQLPSATAAMNPIPFLTPARISSDLPPYSARATSPSPSGHAHIPASISPHLHLHPPAQAIHNRIAGPVHQTSIADMQHDYFHITPARPSSSIAQELECEYLLALTTDPTPLYRIALPRDQDALGAVVMYPASVNPAITPPAIAAPCAVAAARFATDPGKFDAVGSVCVREPFRNASSSSSESASVSSANANANANAMTPNAHWRAIFRSGQTRSGKLISTTYRTQIPIVIIPGMKASVRGFVWRTTPAGTYFELVSEGVLEYDPGRSFEGRKEGRRKWEITSGGEEEGDRGRRVVARVMMHDREEGDGSAEGDTHPYPEVVEVRRGAGVEFECAVLMQVWCMVRDLRR